MTLEWLAIIMFVLFLGLLLVGYPVAFSFAATAVVFGGIGLLLGDLPHPEPQSPVQPLVRRRGEQLRPAGGALLRVHGSGVREVGPSRATHHHGRAADGTAQGRSGPGGRLGGCHVGCRHRRGCGDRDHDGSALAPRDAPLRVRPQVGHRGHHRFGDTGTVDSAQPRADRHLQPDAKRLGGKIVRRRPDPRPDPRRALCDLLGGLRLHQAGGGPRAPQGGAEPLRGRAIPQVAGRGDPSAPAHLRRPWEAFSSASPPRPKPDR